MVEIETVPSEEPIVSTGAFRDGTSRLGSGVNIITSNGASGRLGFTATAVCSVSDTPPSLLVCMNRSSLQNAPLKKNSVLCVNVLSAKQQALSQVFSGADKIAMNERFRRAEWSTLATGSPVLADACVAFDCGIVRVLEVNTHSLMICEVLAIQEHPTVSSLIYFDRTYHPVGRG